MLGIQEERESPVSPAKLLVLALCATLIMGVLSWLIVGRPPFIGIDDAAITRNYAENLARGHGFVYYAGGERVEGATSFLWTVMLAVVYLLTPASEFAIIALCAALTALAIFATFSYAAFAAWRLGMPQRPVVALTLIGVMGMPGYAFWSIFTMMELALWSAALLVLVWRLARLAERPKRWDPGVIAAAFLLPLIRPEGVAAALGLMVLAGLLMGRWPRGLLAAITAAIASAAALTAFRLVYFGWPAPNTFYAKVSSDRVQDLIDGGKYIFSFATGFPFAESLLLIWTAAVVWALLRHLSEQSRGVRAILIGGAAITGVFAIYGALGGDHFAYWRFLMPVAPLLIVAPALAIAAAAPFIMGAAARGPACLAAAAVWIVLPCADLRQARFDLVKEFTLVEQGIAFGTLANGLEPRPSLGVGPAGGIALAYDGRILDLLGLNWVEMAHANPVKTGMRNHASFDVGTFWKHEPDLIAEFERACEPRDFKVRTSYNSTRGLYLTPEFQSAYMPVRIQDGDRCWRGLANRKWLAETANPRIETVDWGSVRFVP